MPTGREKVEYPGWTAPEDLVPQTGQAFLRTVDRPCLLLRFIDDGRQDQSINFAGWSTRQSGHCHDPCRLHMERQLLAQMFAQGGFVDPVSRIACTDRPATHLVHECDQV
jgi:hypothetical protein